MRANENQISTLHSLLFLLLLHDDEATPQCSLSAEPVDVQRAEAQE